MTGHQIKVADSKQKWGGGGGGGHFSMQSRTELWSSLPQYRADDKILHRFRKSLDKLTTEKLISITIS